VRRQGDRRVGVSDGGVEAVQAGARGGTQGECPRIGAESIDDLAGQALGATVLIEVAFALRCLQRDDRRYEGRLDRLEPGMWELRFTVTRGAETYTHTLRQVCGITP